MIAARKVFTDFQMQVKDAGVPERLLLRLYLFSQTLSSGGETQASPKSNQP